MVNKSFVEPSTRMEYLPTTSGVENVPFVHLTTSGFAT